MKITILSSHKHNSYEEKNLIKCAKEKKIAIQKIVITKSQQIDKTVEKIGDCVILRTNKLPSDTLHALLLKINKNSYILGSAKIQFPFLKDKFFQYQYLKNQGISLSRSVQFSSSLELKKELGEELNFPLIMKPNYGFQGRNIKLIKNQKELAVELMHCNILDFIFQNFIPNDGEYRVYMLGGKAVAFLHKIAKTGSYLNNYCQGGYVSKVTDKELKNKIATIASKISGVFKIDFVAIDLFITKDKELIFNELNTLPQWEPLDQVDRNSHLGEKIIDLCIKKCDLTKNLNQNNLLKTVENGMFEDNKYLYGSEFHDLSRLYLWTKNSKIRLKLDRLKNQYLGKNKNELNSILQKIIFQNNQDHYKNKRKFRNEAFSKFPMILNYNKILFLNKFSNSIYGEDISPDIFKHLAKQQIIKYYRALYSNKKAITDLSTQAINFLYLAKTILKKDFQKNSLKLNIKDLADIVLKSKNINTIKPNILNNHIYLLTHIIINETGFYQKKISLPIFKKIINYLEKLILNRYFDVSLDCKFEFLVCAKLCQVKIDILKTLINQEALKSLSNNGLYLVDKLSQSDGKTDSFINSEHRNVLYLMECLKCNI